MAIFQSPKRKIHLSVQTLDQNWQKAIPHLRQYIRKILTKDCVEFCPASLQTPAVSIILTSNSHVQQLNRQYRHHNKPTNVLSFCMPAQYQDKNGANIHFLGDIFFSYEKITEEAMNQGKTMVNHFAHLLIHGFLHLLGYDHQNKNEAKKMEKLEIDLLASLDISNPYIISSPT